MVLKDSCVALLPNFPREKHKQRGHSFPSPVRTQSKMAPPFLDIVEIGPLRWINAMETTPREDIRPNPQGEATLEEAYILLAN